MSKIYRLFHVYTLIVVSFLISFLFPKVLLAQADKTAFDLAYQTYLDQMSKYQKAHQDYVLRKSQYESFRTLQSQQDAQSATVKMLQERDEAVITYLKALKERVNENPGLGDASKSDVVIRINTEIEWFEKHKANIPTAGSLKDLAADSKEASEEFVNAGGTFYKSLASISNGRFSDLTDRFNDKFTELKTKLTEIKGETREEYMFSSDKLQRLDRWVFDAEARMGRAKDKEAEAEVVIRAIGTSDRSVRNLSDAYSSVLSKLGEAQQYMREAGGFLQEIVKNIKTQE